MGWPMTSGARIFQRLADAFAAGNFADAGVAGIVLQHHDVAREERPVRAAQVEQHAVMAGDRHDPHRGDDRRAGSGMGYGHRSFFSFLSRLRA